jgi:anti-anti-sigma factor
MTIKHQIKQGHCRATLGDELAIYNAEALKTDLLQLLVESTHLELDMSQVNDIDSAGVQILLMLDKEANRTGKHFHMINHSDSVLEVLELLDMVGHFGDPVVIPNRRRGS